MSLLDLLWFDFEIDTWPLVMAVLVGVGCGLLGAVFLLRKQALLGDAVSHSVLPGVATGLLLYGMFSGNESGETFGMSTAMIWILAGALVAGILSTALIEVFHRYSRLKEDTALGAVFPAFFALGVILIEVVATGAHFDADCVFYGSLESVGSVSQTIPTLISTLIVIGFFAVAYKEILTTSFDPGLARATGMATRPINFALVALLAAVVVSAFEAVGAILVVAFLIIPPATAYLLVDRFHHVLVLSAGLGALSGFLGCWLTIVLGAVGFETARAPTMALVATAFFMLTLLFGPRHGLLKQLRTRRRLGRRILEENFLGAVYRLCQSQEEGRLNTRRQSGVTMEEVAVALGYPLEQLTPALTWTIRLGETRRTFGERFLLSESGKQRVEAIVRAHRLWESYLIHELGAAPDHVHDAADELEHFLQPALVTDLEKLLDFPPLDPHGREIPRVDKSG